MIRVLLLVSCLCAATLATAQSLADRQPQEELDRVVAIVNDDVIVLSELRERVQSARKQLGQAGTEPPPEHVLQKQVLERLIIERLQLEIAQRTGIRVTDEALNRAVSDIARRNGFSVEQFRDVLERDGFDFGQFREQIKNQILMSQVQQRQVRNRIQVTYREIDNFLATRKKQGKVDNEYRIGHILISVPEAASPEQIADSRRRTDEIFERLRDGADFAQTAASVSDGQQALQGGDLGWRKSTQLPTMFAELVPDMKIGDLRGPIRTPSGFHIIKLMEMRGDDRHIVQQTHARHVLIKPDQLTTTDEARIRLEQIKERVENGEDFGDLARSHSDDPGSASKGGDLGWLSPGDVVPTFQTTMDALVPNQISDPFESRFGWHIVQVLERREYDDTTVARRAKAREQILQRKMEEEMQTWVRQIRDEAFVQYRLEE
jgi:peptidyl-prolyl cis-trans isomerase SurA